MLVGQGASGQRRGHRDRRPARRRRRQGAARQGRPPGRPAVRHRLDRPARHHASYELMDDCDTLLMVGSSFPYSEFLPKEGQARGVQIDIEAGCIGLRYPMEVNLVGDATETLRALIPMLERKEDRRGASRSRTQVERMVAASLDDRAHQDGDPINPQRVFWELSPAPARRRILSADSGSSANWFARDLKLRAGMMASLSGTLATMGPGVPYAIAAKFAYPDRPVIALVGDGAMQMNGNAELITISEVLAAVEGPAPRRAGASTTSDLNQVTWEQRVMSGDPKFRGLAGSRISPTPATRSCSGFKGIRWTAPRRSATPGTQAFARRSAGGDRGDRRSRGPAAAAAHHARAGEEDDQVDAQGRPGARRVIENRCAASSPSSRSRCPGGNLTLRPNRGGRRAARRLGVRGPDRRARVRRHARVGLDDAGRRRGARGRQTGLGYTYAPVAAGSSSRRSSRDEVEGADAMAPAATWEKLGRALRNSGRPGIGCDGALRGRLRALGPESAPARAAAGRRLPRAHDSVPLYGSGGFSSYPLDRLREQLGGWARPGPLAREDEDLPRAGARPGAVGRRAGGDRRRGRALRRLERRLRRGSRRSTGRTGSAESGA